MIILCSCKKDNDEPCDGPNGNIAGHPLDSLGLPFATQEGLNTMGCLVDGEPWKAIEESPFGELSYVISFSLTGDGSLYMYGIDETRMPNDGVSLSASGILEEGTYTITSTAIVYIADGCGGYGIDTTKVNQVEITRVDFDNEILSGTFFMTAVNETCDTVRITNGRFDLSAD